MDEANENPSQINSVFHLCFTAFIACSYFASESNSPKNRKMELWDVIPADSFLVNNAFRANVVDLNKKRKLQDEQLGLPLSKHKCLDRSYSSEHESPFAEDPEADEVFNTCIIKENFEKGHGDEGSEPESEKDSNSFAEDSDFAMSANAERKFEPDYPKTYRYDQPSTSSGSCGSNSFKNTVSSFVGKTIMETNAGKEIFMDSEPNPMNLEEFLNTEDQLPGFGKYTNYICSEYRNGEIEQCSDEDPEDMMLYSNGVTSNMYVLSSGRWSVNQENQVSVRKPTIDQEFEQYFSMLML
ncbi:hypothetical protein HHK36_011033 [Tetracentron sinense]|uniref:Uncharacterized protein n=1 Tax=Tetracentron sinense TaxID=13715 RepID=A0A834ZC42_TETSI|nr:hypothetical protein HHK36_011033 [Tetracentron sinense]